MTAEGLETEKKYDVGSDAALPDLAAIPGVGRVGEPHDTELEAVYFDTEDLVLASRRITLRRRRGGADAGWHVKLPPEPAAGAGPASEEAPGARREIHAPLGQADVVPGKLLAHLHAYLRGSDPVPVARLNTRRTTHALYGDDGMHLADFADDTVDAELLQGAGQKPAGESAGREQQWREWELELVHGQPEVFAAAAEVLSAAGARPSAHESKLRRALGEAAPKAPGPAETDGTAATEGGVKQPGGRKPGKKWPASAVVSAYLDGQISEILANDARVRLEEPDAVHAMRSATRRVRSALAVYRKLYGRGAVGRLRDELKWLGRILGTPRDAEVMLERLRTHTGKLPPGEAADDVKRRIERELGTRLDAGYRKTQEVLLTDRYFRLLDDLEYFRDHPPVRPAASAPARKAARKLVGKPVKRLRRAHKAVLRAKDGAGERPGMELKDATGHETALHQVRKDAKRLRHAAETVGPVFGKRATRLAKAAHKQQKILGDHHDSVMARIFLGKLASGPDLPEPVAAAYGSLLKREQKNTAKAQAKYRKAHRKSRKLVRRGVE
ncbi:CYTH and CHAD domain-containing protein [Arthrobacter sp. ISL-65]|uniref:CYTH and CHAD domain-containing protein n=1 Tax=Arthrobacter sp. ISL-65 TaxID=2819112 RepID=UPI001BEA1C87|nr:CYTH and CHAD domain-containing protein [Arthrobacter sp. ISL-65]MBT2547361.1 CYTH and CHAD domain-containing protein [Arthrobacter sp. ISL-65]